MWQVQWELDDDELASLPETGWTVKDAVRDDDYDDCDGFAYTIVHPGIEEEFVVSASALFKPSKPVRKPKGRALESSRKFTESEGGVTCHATCVDWDAPKTKTFKTLAQCKRWMETTADEIASEWGSMVEGLAVWAEDDELIVISGNGKVVAKFKIVPDYEDFHDPDEYYQESDNKKFGRKFNDRI